MEGTTSSQQSFRLGLRYVKGLREVFARRLEEERLIRPFSSIQDLARRCNAKSDELTQLAYSGALASFDHERRAALWQVAHVNRSPGPIFDQLEEKIISPLPVMNEIEKTEADYEASNLTVGTHFLSYQRLDLKAQGIYSTKDLMNVNEGAYVKTAGALIVRQRPSTAKGFVFLTLEDEFGMVQAIVAPNLFDSYRSVLLGYHAIIVEGVLQKNRGALFRARATLCRSIGSQNSQSRFLLISLKFRVYCWE